MVHSVHQLVANMELVIVSEGKDTNESVEGE